MGLADLALKGSQYVATHHYGSVFTIGRVHVHPGAFTVIPGRSDFSIDFRSTSKDTLEEIKNFLKTLASDIASTRGLEFKSKIVDQSKPVQIPAWLMDSIKKSSEKLGYPHMILPSGAGHDAQVLADITETGMIFIPCEDGISHSPKENIKWEDLEKGANVLLHTLIDLAS